MVKPTSDEDVDGLVLIPMLEIKLNTSDSKDQSND